MNNCVRTSYSPTQMQPLSCKCSHCHKCNRYHKFGTITLNAAITIVQPFTINSAKYYVTILLRHYRKLSHKLLKCSHYPRHGLNHTNHCIRTVVERHVGNSAGEREANADLADRIQKSSGCHLVKCRQRKEVVVSNLL